MKCDDARVELFAHHRGELDDETRNAVEGHLAACQSCKVEWSEILETVSEIERHSAPLDLPASMKQGALAQVTAMQIEPLLRDVGDAPPPHLKDEALRRAVGPSPARSAPRLRLGRGPRRLAVAGLAAAAVIAGMFAITYRSGLRDARRELAEVATGASEAERQLGPLGHAMQTLPLSGEGVSAEVELYHFRHDNFRIVLDMEQMPVTPSGHHYEVWLTGPKGDVSVGSFRIKKEDRFTNSWVLGVDPVDFPHLVLTLEPNDGRPGMSSRVVATGEVDPADVYHGTYDE